MPHIADIAARDTIPVIVGVTGHRDLNESDLPEIRERLKIELSLLTKLLPHSPHFLLSALAEGSDQLVAEVALELGWQVVAVLPMPLNDFVEDFPTENAKDKFRSLLVKCIATIEVPWADQLDPDIVDPRRQQYRSQGVFIAQQAQVVIALWDGEPRQPGACGTALVVDVCRGSPPPFKGSALVAHETTGLIHIPVRRQKATDKSLAALYALESDRGHERVLGEVDALNKALRKNQQYKQKLLAESHVCVIPAEKREQMDAGSLWLLERYGEVDMLARHYQGQRKTVIIAASVITVAAALCQATYAVLAAQPWIVAYGVAIVLAYGLYLLLFRMPAFRIEDRYLEYRALAEAVRVQLFWRLSGLNKPVADYYLQYVKTEVGWVREAVRNLGFKANLMSPQLATNPELVRDHWLCGQEMYFLVNARKRRMWQGRANLVATLAVGGGALLVLLTGIGHLVPDLELFKQLGSAYSASFFLAAGVVKGFASTMCYEQEAASFEKAGGVFRNAREFFQAEDGDTVNFQASIAELGKYAMAENADWLLQHRRNAFKIQN